METLLIDLLLTAIVFSALTFSFTKKTTYYPLLFTLSMDKNHCR